MWQVAGRVARLRFEWSWSTASRGAAESASSRSVAVVLAVAFVCFGSSVCFAGWERLPSWTSSGLSSIVFKNERLGWATAGGSIAHTSDGGQTWVVQLSRGGAGFADMDFGDTLVGIAVGDSYLESYEVQTSDGGVTWEHVARDPIYSSLNDCRLLSSACGWVLGSVEDYVSIPPYIYDYASSWPNGTHFYSQQGYRLHDIDAIDSLTAWIAGHDDQYVGEVLRTTDGGDSWSVVNTGLGRHVMACDFLDYEQGWILGHDGAVFHTTDGGFNWATQLDTSLVLNGIAFADTLNGWVVGGGGLILRTRDGGMNWVAEPSGVVANLNAASVIDTLNTWAAGDSGTILHYAPNAGVAEPTLKRPLVLTRLRVKPGIGRSSFRFSVQSGGAGVRWRVRDAAGREVWTCEVSHGEVSATWPACDQSSRRCPAGAYFVQADCRGQRLVSRLLLVR